MSGAEAGRWAAVLGHELRNPLAAALTGTAVLRELLDADDPRAPVADGVLRDLQRLGRLVDSYLELARVGRPRCQRVALGDVCRAVAARRSGAVTLAVAAEAHALADPHLLERALDNLLDNALQAGARHVRIALQRSGDRLLLQVDDDGPGVAESARAHLFQPGFSGKGSTGLGLCIVDQVVRAHGGTVEHQPLPRGTRFCITLPAAVAAPMALCGAAP